MEKGMYFLDQKDMPTHWYNIMADMPGDMPPLLHPGTGKPATVDDAAGLFSRACAEQELNRTDRWIEIPEELQAVYRTWRPTVLHRAYRLEKALDTPAKIFYKYE
ncbi:MAG: TrpB-like pyridoxal-phosphate dependent enzyme, partial [Dehalococcoidia bacterium]